MINDTHDDAACCSQYACSTRLSSMFFLAISTHRGSVGSSRPSVNLSMEKIDMFCLTPVAARQPSPFAPPRLRASAVKPPELASPTPRLPNHKTTNQTRSPPHSSAPDNTA